MRTAQKDLQVTSLGYTALEKEYKEVLTRIKAARKRYAHAVELGDAPENSAMDQAIEDLSTLLNRRNELQYRLKVSKIVKPTRHKTVQMGSIVSILWMQKVHTFTLVSGIEANPIVGKLSIDSPLGKALLHKKEGATVTVEINGSPHSIEILAVG